MSFQSLKDTGKQKGSCKFKRYCTQIRETDRLPKPTYIYQDRVMKNKTSRTCIMASDKKSRARNNPLRILYLNYKGKHKRNTWKSAIEICNAALSTQNRTWNSCNFLSQDRINKDSGILVIRKTRIDGYLSLYRMSKLEKRAEKAEQKTMLTWY